MKVLKEIEVEIDKLVKSPLNSREDVDTSYIDLSKGMIYLPICRESSIESGMYEVVVGWTRVVRAREEGWKTVKIQVQHLTNEEAKLLDLISNYQRKGLSPVEEGKSFKRALKLGLTKKDITGATCKSMRFVETRLQFLEKLHPEVAHAVRYGTNNPKEDEKTVTFDKARKLVNLPHDEQLIVAGKIHGRGYTSEGVADLIKKAEKIHKKLWSIRDAKIREELVEKYDNNRWDWGVTLPEIREEINSKIMIKFVSDKKRITVALPTRESQFYKVYHTGAEGFSEEEAEDYAKRHNGYYVKKIDLSFYLVDVELSDEMCLDPSYWENAPPVEIMPILVEQTSVICVRCGKPVEKRMMKSTPSNVFCAKCMTEVRKKDKGIV